MGERAQADRWWLVAGIVAAGVGIVVALVVVRVGVGETEVSRSYIEQPEYAVWGGLVLLQVPVWTVLGVVSARWTAEIRSSQPSGKRSGRQLLLAGLGAAAALAVLFAVPLLAMPHYNVGGHELRSPLEPERGLPDALAIRVSVMGVIVAVAASVAVVALWEVHRAAAAIDPAEPTAGERFSRLWSRQRSLLAVISVVLAVVMLTTAAKAQANSSFAVPGGSRLPEASASHLLVQGILYGAILLAFYLPPYFATRGVGEALVDAVYPTPSSDQAKAPIDAAEEWLDTREARQRYRVAIGLDESTLQRFERGAALLAPLLTALLTSLVPDLQL